MRGAQAAFMHNALHRQWRSLAIRGLAAVVFAICAFGVPTLTLSVLFLVAGAYLCIDGVLLALIAVRARFEVHTWILFAEGVVGMAMGAAVLFLTPLTPELIGMWLAIWAIATGLLEAWLAFRMRSFVFSGPYWAIGAAISLLLGVLLMVQPALVATTLVFLLGLYATFIGLAMLALAWTIRGFERRLRPFGPAAVART